MSQLSSALWMLKPRYNAVIIGSGYGGAIAANRLARSRFPDDQDEAFKQSTLDTPGHRKGADNGLYYFHFDKEVTVLQGCGLGGTSLINANVSLHPEDRVFKDERWPMAIREDVGGRLAAGFDQARAMLRPVEYVGSAEYGLKKYDALKAAAGPDANVYHAPINVNLKDGV